MKMGGLCFSRQIEYYCCMEKPQRRYMPHVLRYLKGNRLMTIATTTKGLPWAATVFFAYTPTPLTLLFFSKRSTRHGKAIDKNPRVAVTINQDWGSRGKVRGLQLEGTAAPVPKKELRALYTIFKTRFLWADTYPDHTLYCVRPQHIFYIDQELFGHFTRVRSI